MPLALAPQCCCGGPGFIRVAGGHLFYNAADDYVDGHLRRWPCWFVPYDLPGNAYEGDYPGSEPYAWFAAADWPETPDYLFGPVTGYDHHEQKLYWAGTLNYMDQDAVGPTGVGYPGLISGVVDDCELHGGSVFNSGGYVNCDVILNIEDWTALLASTIPTGYEQNQAPTDTITFLTGQMTASLTGVSNGRLWGVTRVWRYDEDDHQEGRLIGWSIAKDGTDYQEVFDRYKGFPDYGDLAFTLNVCDGTLYFFEGDTLYADNSSLGSMTGLSAGRANNSAAKRRGGSQIIVTQFNAWFFGGGEAGIAFIFESGGNTATNQLQFVLKNDDDEDVELVCVGMAHDEEKDCIVLKWMYPNFWDHTPPWWGEITFATYIRGDVDPGNLIGQENVLVYGQFPCGRAWKWGTYNGLSQYAFPPFPDSWGVVISGRMPRPTTITAGHPEPPPPPPPDGPDCSGTEECEDLPNLDGGMSGHQNYTDDHYDTQSGVMNWQMANLNMGFSLPWTGAGAGIQTFRKNYVVSLYDYSDPGRFFASFDSDNGSEFDLELYLTGLEIFTICEDGYIRIYQMTIWYQVFSDPTGAQNPLGEGNWSGVPYQNGRGLSLNCRSSIISGNFKYENLLILFEGDGSHSFQVTCAMGGVE